MVTEHPLKSMAVEKIRIKGSFKLVGEIIFEDKNAVLKIKKKKKQPYPDTACVIFVLMFTGLLND